MIKLLLHKLFLFLLFFYGNVEIKASNAVTILNKGCNYSINIPEGWDTIPNTVLQEKLKQYNADLGIYPITQKDYFNGNYALFVFVPTIKTLNLLTFEQIVSEQEKQKKQGEINNDTLHVRFIQAYPEVKDGAYSIYRYYKAQHRSDSLNTCQALRLTKFGYVMVLAYQKDIAGTIPIEKVSALLSGSISVQPDYIYSEPQKKGISLKHILISLAIGVLAYVVITVISKIKKKK